VLIEQTFGLHPYIAFRTRTLSAIIYPLDLSTTSFGVVLWELMTARIPHYGTPVNKNYENYENKLRIHHTHNTLRTHLTHNTLRTHPTHNTLRTRTTHSAHTSRTARHWFLRCDSVVLALPSNLMPGDQAYCAGGNQADPTAGAGGDVPGLRCAP
jgi:hypothetical protein